MTLPVINARDRGLDVVRSIACIMIVLMHAPLPSSSDSSIFLCSVSFFTAPGIGLFFMVSGALLLPVKEDMFVFLKRRLYKIVLPLLLWTAVYVGADILTSRSEINIMHTMFSFPFTPQGTSVFWFIYVLVGIYFMAPIISPWLHSCTKKEIQFVLCLWGVTLCFPIIELFATVNTGVTGVLYYFTGYAGYFLLGYYMKRWPESINWKIIIPLVIVTLLIAILCKINDAVVNFYTMFWYLSIFIVILCMAIFKFCTEYLDSLNVSLFARYSFGIYLCHILIMRGWLWKTRFIASISDYYVQTFAIATLTLVLSFMLTAVLAHLPLSNLTVGIKSKSIR